MAYNLTIAVKRLCLPEACQGWTLPTLLRQLARLPAVLGQPARVLLARVAVPAAWLAWWENWEARGWPRALVGRPSD